MGEERLLLLHVKVKGQLVREVHSLLPSCGFQELSSGLQLDGKCLYTLSHLAGPLPRSLTEELDTNVSFWSACAPNKPNFPVHSTLTFCSDFTFHGFIYICFPRDPRVAGDHLGNDDTDNLSRLELWYSAKRILKIKIIF